MAVCRKIDRLCALTSKVRCRAAFCDGQPSDTLSYDPKCPHSVSDTAIHDVLNIQCVRVPVALTNGIELKLLLFQSVACWSGCGGRLSPPSPSSPGLPASPHWQAGPGTGLSMMASLTGCKLTRSLIRRYSFRRYYAHHTPMAMAYHKRDMQHSKPSFWQTYVRWQLINCLPTLVKSCHALFQEGPARQRHRVSVQQPQRPRLNTWTCPMCPFVSLQ